MNPNQPDPIGSITSELSGQISIQELPINIEQQQQKSLARKQEEKQQNKLTQHIKEDKQADLSQLLVKKASVEIQTEKVEILTSKQLKKMSKMMLQLEQVKKQYQKMRANYQILRTERDQYKQVSQDYLNKYQNAWNQLQSIKRQQLQAKGQIQRKKIDLQSAVKRIEEYRKNESVKQGLEQKVRQLQMIIDMTTKAAEQQKKSEEKWKNEVDKQKELLRLEKESVNNIKHELQRLRIVEGETFVLKQELVRISGQYKNLKIQKEQQPMMLDKFEHQEQIISELKDTIKEMEISLKNAKHLNQKLEKRTSQLLQQKKDMEKRFTKSRCDLEQAHGEMQAIKVELEQQRHEWQVQKKRYTTQIRTLKVQLHNQHQKLKITEWQLSQSRKKEKKPIQLERVSIMSLSKEDLLNYLEEMEMKNQSLKLNLNQMANKIHQYEKRIKEQQASIMALARQITKDYPNMDESQGMAYVEKDIIEIGLSQKNDWAEIVEKVMIQNLRLKDSVTALGQEYNQKLRKQLQK